MKMLTKMSGSLGTKSVILSSAFFVFINSLSAAYTFNQIENKLEEGMTFKAVHKILNYLQNHPETINDDVLFGVILAKSNLNWLVDRYRGIPSALIQFLEIVKMCDKILEENPSENTVLLSLSKIWENGAQDISYGNMGVESDEFVLPNFETCQDIQDLITKNMAKDSDACINELVDSDCHPTFRCWSPQEKENYVGYAGTHLLIYSQIAYRLNCAAKNEKIFVDIKLKIQKLCQSMLTEATAFYNQTYFSLVRDLFLEQIALCGVEGYAEFAPKAWRKEVLTWQSERGCFGHDMHLNRCSSLEPFNRSKRSDFLIDGCHTHVTAVALGTLAFFLRHEFNADLMLSHSPKPSF